MKKIPWSEAKFLRVTCCNQNVHVRGYKIGNLGRLCSCSGYKISNRNHVHVRLNFSNFTTLFVVQICQLWGHTIFFTVIPENHRAGGEKGGFSRDENEGKVCGGG